MNKVIKYLKKKFGDKQMKLDMKKADELIQKKWRNGCPMCGGRNWSVVGYEVFTPISIGDGNSLQLGGKIIPLIPISCTNCGFTAEINGMIAGILDDEEKKDGSDK